MELKRRWNVRVPCSDTLLIVPYGIETLVQGFFWKTVHLLIVPYGIETM